MDDHLDLNRAHWDERVPAHVASPGYAVEELVVDSTALSDVVRFDAPRLGDIRGLRGVHLQCHIGTDTISLERLGADMTGLDFSEPAIEAARRLADRCGLSTEFVQAEFHDAPEVLAPGAFDLVYTGIGALCWLPRIADWAAVVNRLLAPGGRLFVREGHPLVWAVDERECAETGVLPLGFPYFETSDGLRWTDDSTYVDTETKFSADTTISFNHGIGEVITALLAEGLTITGFEEHDSVPWEAVPGCMERDDGGEWRLKEGYVRLPLTYTLQATKAAIAT